MRPNLQCSNWRYITMEKRINGKESITNGEQSREDRPEEDSEVGQQEDRDECSPRSDGGQPDPSEGVDPYRFPVVRFYSVPGT